MSYKVTIVFTGVVAEDEQMVAGVCRLFAPLNAYIDTPAYVEGHSTDYGKSVYATNVPGWGSIPQVEPYASTSIPFSVPLAQFKLAAVGEDNMVEFEVEDYKEAFFYKGIGAELADQGFQVTVEKVTDPEPEEEPEEEPGNEPDEPEVTG